MRDLTRTSGWRNTRARIDREPNSVQKTINKELMHYIKTLEDQIMILSRQVEELKGANKNEENTNII